MTNSHEHRSNPAKPGAPREPTPPPQGPGHRHHRRKRFPLGVILNLLPLLLFVGFVVWMGRQGRALAGGITGVGRSKARVYRFDDRPATRFGDVTGYEGAKQEVTEVVDFLKHPDKFRHAGAIGPRGVLVGLERGR